jgi:excinuclease ABC subunit B
MQFKLHAPYEPAGDQPQAIEQLADLYNRGTQASVLLGVTGSGKTFTMANLVEKLQRPTLVISHNKTLAAQLYAEFKGFFPENAVEYFVSYYDYYQPEAYLPVTDVYIEKDLSINDEIEKLRLSTSSALLSGRRDVLVVSSVSCLYGIGNPDDFHANTITLRTGEKEDFNKLLYRLVDALYSRNENEFKRGTFRVRGDVVDVYLAYDDIACRIAFWGNTIDSIERLDPLTGGVLERVEGIAIYPASAFCIIEFTA